MGRIYYRTDGLRALMAVHRTGSFVRAADALHITQSAFSRRIAQLEEALGACLVERSTRQVVLSPLGLELVRGATPLFAGLDEALEEAGRRARGEAGRIVVACLSSLVRPLLGAVLPKFREQYPQMRMHLRDDMAQVARDTVLSGEAEFGIGTIGARVAVLHVDHIADDPFVLAFRRGHSLAARSEIGWAELAPWRPAALRTSTVGPAVDALLEADIEPPWFDEVQHFASLAALLRDGMSVGVATVLASRGCTEGLEFRPLTGRPSAARSASSSALMLISVIRPSRCGRSSLRGSSCRALAPCGIGTMDCAGGVKCSHVALRIAHGEQHRSRVLVDLLQYGEPLRGHRSPGFEFVLDLRLGAVAAR